MAKLNIARDRVTDGRQRGRSESASEYQAYRVYRDLGPTRTLAAAWHAHRQTSTRPAKSRGRPRLWNAETRHPSGQWTALSSRGQWVERAAIYDARVDVEERARRLQEIQELERQRVQVQLAARQRLEELVWKIEARLDEADTGPITGFTDWKREVTGKKVVETKTHVEGVDLSAYASLVRQANEIARLAIVGVPVAYDESRNDDSEHSAVIRDKQGTDAMNAVRRVSSKVVLRPDRLPGEPVRAYRAFRVYRDQGPRRSLRAAWISGRQRDMAPQSCRSRLAHGATRRSAGHWTEWSSQWNWVERAAAYDAMVDKSKQKAQGYCAREMAKQRLDFEIANQHRLENRLEKIGALTIKALEAPIVGSTHSTTRRWWDGRSVETKTRIEGLDITGYAALVKQVVEICKQRVRPTHR